MDVRNGVDKNGYGNYLSSGDGDVGLRNADDFDGG